MSTMTMLALSLKTLMKMNLQIRQPINRQNSPILLVNALYTTFVFWKLFYYFKQGQAGPDTWVAKQAEHMVHVKDRLSWLSTWGVVLTDWQLDGPRNRINIRRKHTIITIIHDHFWLFVIILIFFNIFFVYI